MFSFELNLSLIIYKEKKINLFDYRRIKQRKKLSDKRSRGFQCLYASYHDKMDCSFLDGDRSSLSYQGQKFKRQVDNDENAVIVTWWQKCLVNYGIAEKKRLL